MRTALLFVLCAVPTLALPDPPPTKLAPSSAPSGVAAKVPSCAPLPPLKQPIAFGAGETLEFALDAMGATAGSMTMKVLPTTSGAMPIEVRAATNTFFSKVRRVKGVATSYLDPRTLRPSRYTEDTVENEIHKTAEVSFDPANHDVKLRWTWANREGRSQYRYEHDGLDVAGAVYLMRQLPLKAGAELCFDVYGIRRLWRMNGKVVAREHVSLPVGEFDTWHLAGDAVRLDDPRVKREVHVWITDDERRLPVVALGAIDLGAVRATLTSFSRPGERKRAEGKQSLKW